MEYIHGAVEAEGITLPAQHRAYRADADGKAIPDQLMVAIDFSDIIFE